MANARKIAVNALVKVNESKGYSNIVFSNALSEYKDISSADKALAAMLFYGVLDRKITLDYFLSLFMKSRVEKLKPVTREALRIAVYQIMFADKIPPSAAVNESVNIVKNSKEKYNAAFVNGVLRTMLRQPPKMPEGNDVKALSIKYSCPESFVSEIINDYGTEAACAFLEASLKSPPVYIRVNTVKTNEDELLSALEKEGINAQKTDFKNALEITGGIDVLSSSAYKNGLFHIEDLSCQKTLAHFNLKKGERVLDMCAAPGGKTFTMAQMLENSGEIRAFDLHQKRADLITDGAKRLGLTNIIASASDATVYNADLGKFDAVLCDVPCSGFGVIRRKPEIKYKGVSDFSALEEIQLKILNNADNYLKAGGRIIYSTCTVRRAENTAAVQAFLDKHPCYELKYEYTYMPHTDKTDGFYFALIEKCR